MQSLISNALLHTTLLCPEAGGIIKVEILWLSFSGVGDIGFEDGVFEGGAGGVASPAGGGEAEARSDGFPAAERLRGDGGQGAGFLDLEGADLRAEGGFIEQPDEIGDGDGGLPGAGVVREGEGGDFAMEEGDAGAEEGDGGEVFQPGSFFLSGEGEEAVEGEGEGGDVFAALLKDAVGEGAFTIDDLRLTIYD